MLLGAIDAVRTEPETTASLDSEVDRIKVATFMGTDRPHLLRQAIPCCRNFGVVSIVGVYAGATETEFFARADMLDTKVGTDKKDSRAFVAKLGFNAMKKGEGEVITGWKNKMQAAIAHIAPADVTAEMHRKMAERKERRRLARRARQQETAVEWRVGRGLAALSRDSRRGAEQAAPDVARDCHR